MDHSGGGRNSSTRLTKGGWVSLVAVLLIGLVAGFGVALIAGSHGNNWLNKNKEVLKASLTDAFGNKSVEPALELDLNERNRKPGVNVNKKSASLTSEENSAPAAKAISKQNPVVNEKTENPKIVAKKATTEQVQTSAAPPACEVPSGDAEQVISINEVAWMGTDDAANEWIELKNNSGENLSLAGWRLLTADENLDINFSAEEKISAHGFYLLERTDDASVPNVHGDHFYSGALSNRGAKIELINKNCERVDMLDALSGWPGGDNETKQTLERKINSTWQTSANAFGTPRAENSAGKILLVTSTSTSTPTTTIAQKYFRVVIATVGTGVGTAASEPSGISCSPDCEENFLAGTPLTLTAAPGWDAVFTSWSGACSGDASTCTINVSKDMEVTATFTRKTPVAASEPPPSSQPQVSAQITINEVFYDAEGSDAGKEFVELRNPSANAVDLLGWSLKNADTSLVSIGSKSEDKTSIPAGGSFLLGLNSYTGSPVADTVRSASLPNAAANLHLFNKDGAEIDSMSYVAEAVTPGQSLNKEGSGFIPAVPTPQNSQ